MKTLSELSTRPDTIFDLLEPVYGLPGASGAILAGPETQTTVFDAAPDPSGSYWLAFTDDHDEGNAAATFRRRYGQPPRWVFENLGLLLVGPVPDEEV